MTDEETEAQNESPDLEITSGAENRTQNPQSPNPVLFPLYLLNRDTIEVLIYDPVA